MVHVRATPPSSESHDFEMGLSKAWTISDCRASIDHPERFLLEPLMVKYFMWVLSLLTLPWCCNRAVSFPFCFLSLSLFLFLKDDVGHLLRGAKLLCTNILFFYAASFRRAAKSYSAVEWCWCKPTHQVLSAQALPHSPLSEVRTVWMPQQKLHSIPVSSWNLTARVILERGETRQSLLSQKYVAVLCGQR